jgi:hypothetical protein
MPLFGKTGAKARDFFSSPVGQQVLAWGSQMVPGDPYGQFRANEARMAQREQLGTAFTDLLGQMRGPDTMTPQVNELIGGANMRGGQVGMAPMQMQTPRRAGLDYADPATQDALKRYLMAGGNLQTPQGIAEAMQPPRMQTFNTRSGVVGVNPETGEVEELYRDPYAEALAERQAEALEAQAYQRRAQGSAALTRAARPPASRTGSGQVGPTPTGRTY